MIMGAPLNWMQTPGFGTGQVQLPHGAGNTDVAQAAFFLDATEILHRHLVREQAFFHTAHEH
jgi:tetrahydromethanopterin S-methyltransferase subunit D